MQPGEFNLEGHQVYPDRGPTLHGCTDLCSVDSTTNRLIASLSYFGVNSCPQPHGAPSRSPARPSVLAVSSGVPVPGFATVYFRLTYLLTTYAELRGAGGSRCGPDTSIVGPENGSDRRTKFLARRSGRPVRLKAANSDPGWCDECGATVNHASRGFGQQGDSAPAPALSTSPSACMTFRSRVLSVPLALMAL